MMFCHVLYSNILRRLKHERARSYAGVAVLNCWWCFAGWGGCLSMLCTRLSPQAEAAEKSPKLLRRGCGEVFALLRGGWIFHHMAYFRSLRKWKQGKAGRSYCVAVLNLCGCVTVRVDVACPTRHRLKRGGGRNSEDLAVFNWLRGCCWLVDFCHVVCLHIRLMWEQALCRTGFRSTLFRMGVGFCPRHSGRQTIARDIKILSQDWLLFMLGQSADCRLWYAEHSWQGVSSLSRRGTCQSAAGFRAKI